VDERERKICPECDHIFQGNGFDGIDAHWRSKHEGVMPYEEAWPLLNPTLAGEKRNNRKLNQFESSFAHRSGTKLLSITLLYIRQGSVMSFTHTWSFIQSNLKPGENIDNQTFLKGRFGENFTVDFIDPNNVHIVVASTQTIQQIPRVDFDKIYKVWDQYKTGTYRRQMIRFLTRYSKYIISIFYWIEMKNNGKLP
jgi:hypothetical protein